MNTAETAALVTDRACIALLKAIAEKLIPGIPEQTRVSLLQQTRISDANADDFGSPEGAAGSQSTTQGPKVLEEVIDRATAKSELEQEINGEPLRHKATYEFVAKPCQRSPRASTARVRTALSVR